MDIARPDLPAKRRRRRLAIGAVAIVLMLGAAVAVSRLEPAAPSVDAATMWIDTVKRGELIRDVRGIGTLVPEDIRWIPATSDARVERIVVHPGTVVKADTIILELSNDELQLSMLDAESQYRAADAQLAEARARIEATRLDQQASAARVASEARQARLRANAEAELARDGLVAELNANLSKAAAEELESRSTIEQERLRITTGSIDAQIAVARATVEQRRAVADLRRAQVNALRVRAGIDGVLQQVPVEVGQRVTPGTNLARVAEPSRLKAVIRVPETLAKDITIGLPCKVDTRNGIVDGRVARVDPAVQAGTVAVDIALTGPLARGARPDLTVDGTIELERLRDVLSVGRPAQAAENATLGLFRVDPATQVATRTSVQLGRASVNQVEVRSGLREGDRVILSDTSTWDAVDRLKLR
ncbi:MAG: HlyD family efflux transporter periplasmic adaptor subunit [Acidobacteria bacterium]|nr:HlyD family efflux transporter periplasmic adaptor subunit [Acidobacteriota bacterium]